MSSLNSPQGTFAKKECRPQRSPPHRSLSNARNPETSSIEQQQGPLSLSDPVVTSAVHGSRSAPPSFSHDLPSIGTYDLFGEEFGAIIYDHDMLTNVKKNMDGVVLEQADTPASNIPTLPEDALFNWLAISAGATNDYGPASLLQSPLDVPPSCYGEDRPDLLAPSPAPSQSSSALSVFLDELLTDECEGRRKTGTSVHYESCDRCIEQGLKCFISANAQPTAKKCLNCRDVHLKCTINGVNVCDSSMAYRIQREETRCARPKLRSRCDAATTVQPNLDIDTDSEARHKPSRKKMRTSVLSDSSRFQSTSMYASLTSQPQAGSMYTSLEISLLQDTMHAFQQLINHLADAQGRSAVGPTLTLLIDDVESLSHAGTHPAFAKLIIYLQRLREVCEKPLSTGELQDQLASSLLSQTLGRRCISLLRILVDEAS